MKRLVLLAAAAAGVAGAVSGAPAMAQRVVAVVGDPGPGWTAYHEHRSYHGGPYYYTGAGAHHGWYRWHSSYYQNCGWRATRHHGREWRCW